MTIPTAINQDDPLQRWAQFRTAQRQIETNVKAIRDKLNGTGRTANDVLTAALLCSDLLRAIAQAKADPELVEIARREFRNPTYDLATEVAQTETALTGFIDWVVANFPQSANGYIELQQFQRSTQTPGDLSFIQRQITDPQATAVVSRIDTILVEFV